MPATKQNYITISDVSGSYGCHNDDDRGRAIEAAEAILAGVNAAEAMAAFIAKINDEAHDSDLAAKWESAQVAADKAFTEGWANPDNVFIHLEAR